MAKVSTTPILSLRHDEVERLMPRLPVPPLDVTLKKYLETLKPFAEQAKGEGDLDFRVVNDCEVSARGVKVKSIGVAAQNELDRNAELAKDFANSEQGKRLQAQLENRARTAKYSWLEEWWFNWAYYEYRDPVPINVTYKMRFEDNSARPNIGQIQRAAILCEGFMWLKNLIEAEKYEVEMREGKPLCMATHRYIFHTCRIPHPTRDFAEFYTEKEVTNIVVLRNGQFYSFEAYHPNGFPLTALEYEDCFVLIVLGRQLKRIIEAESKQTVRYPPMGALTTENRTVWSLARVNLMQHQQNIQSLKMIQKSAFVLCLDDTTPKDDQEVSYRLLVAGHEHLYNRFYDKGLQLIVFKNGKAGIAGEHSRMDGQPLGLAFDLMLDREPRITNEFFNATTPVAKAILPQPSLLHWKIDERIYSDLSLAISRHHKAISNLELRLLNTTSFGKADLKKYKVSPDAVFQIAMQLAYYRQHRKIAPTYESASTRQYARGRTETGRSANASTVEFIKKMDLSGLTESQKFDLFQKAATAHVTYVREAVKGFGVDRHLLGLRLLAMENGEALHPLFKDELFSRSNYWRLSTSQLDLKHVQAIGFGPVVPDGYGVCYLISKDHIMTTITAFGTGNGPSIDAFSTQLEKALLDVFNLIKANKLVDASEKKMKAKL